jgi:hypothetical protein
VGYGNIFLLEFYTLGIAAAPIRQVGFSSFTISSRSVMGLKIKPLKIKLFKNVVVYNRK